MAHHRSAGEGILCLDLHRLSLGILAGCVLAEAGLLFLDYHLSYGGLEQPEPVRHLTSIVRADGLASWFSSMQTMLLGVTALAVCRVTAHRDSGSWRTLGWLALGLACICFAVDEGARLHQGVASTVSASGSGPASWLGTFPDDGWQALFLAVFALLGLLTLVFLWRELGDATGRALLLCASAFLAGAITLDVFEALDPAHPLNPDAWLEGMLEIEGWARARFHATAHEALRHFAGALGASLELLAVTLLWFVSLRHLARTTEGILIQITASE